MLTRPALILALAVVLFLAHRSRRRWQPWPVPERVSMADFGLASGWRELERVDSV